MVVVAAAAAEIIVMAAVATIRVAKRICLQKPGFQILLNISFVAVKYQFYRVI